MTCTGQSAEDQCDLCSLRLRIPVSNAQGDLTVACNQLSCWHEQHPLAGRQPLALPVPLLLSTPSCHAVCRQRARKRRSPPPAADSAAELLRAELQEARLVAVLEEQRMQEMQASNHEHTAAHICSIHKRQGKFGGVLEARVGCRQAPTRKHRLLCAATARLWPSASEPQRLSWPPAYTRVQPPRTSQAPYCPA